MYKWIFHGRDEGWYIIDNSFSTITLNFLQSQNIWLATVYAPEGEKNTNES